MGQGGGRLSARREAERKLKRQDRQPGPADGPRVPLPVVTAFSQQRRGLCAFSVSAQAGGLGLEPRLADPESAALPLRRSPSDSQRLLLYHDSRGKASLRQSARSTDFSVSIALFAQPGPAALVAGVRHQGGDDGRAAGGQRTSRRPDVQLYSCDSSIRVVRDSNTLRCPAKHWLGFGIQNPAQAPFTAVADKQVLIPLLKRIYVPRMGSNFGQ